MTDAKVVKLNPKKPDVEITEFGPGDVVQMRAGGMPMTVRKATKANVSCDWHNEGGELCSADFPPPMLLICSVEMEIEVELVGSDETAH